MCFAINFDIAKVAVCDIDNLCVGGCSSSDIIA